MKNYDSRSLGHSVFPSVTLTPYKFDFFPSGPNQRLLQGARSQCESEHWGRCRRRKLPSSPDALGTSRNSNLPRLQSTTGNDQPAKTTPTGTQLPPPTRSSAPMQTLPRSDKLSYYITPGPPVQALQRPSRLSHSTSASRFY